MDLFEMMRGAGGGGAFEALARNYGVAPADMERAVEAMMPAFSAGLRRNTAEPADLFDFARAISTGRHAAYYDDPGRAFAASGVDEGNAILGHLFGSKDVSRAVADQVHQATGLGEAVLKQMLPVLANMVLGGLFKQGRGGSNATLDELLRKLGGAAAPPSGADRRGPLDRYEDAQAEREAAEEQAAAERQTRQREAARDNPFGRMMEDFLGGAGSGEAAGGVPEGGAGKQVFGEMFEPGRKMGETYQRNMESIFDRFLSGMDRRR